jgi:hypothetical protein
MVDIKEKDRREACPDLRVAGGWARERRRESRMLLTGCGMGVFERL